MKTTGLILAGGLSRRMGGGDKGFKMLGGISILQRVMSRTSPQCDDMLLNINGNEAAFSGFNIPIVKDLTQDFAGPLAGILAGMRALKDTKSTHLFSIPCDSPFLPHNIVEICTKAMLEQNADVVSVSSNNQTHPIIALWSLQLADDLERSLTTGQRKIDKFTSQYKTIYVDFPHIPYDPFFNCNEPQDLSDAAQILLQNPQA